MSESALSRSGAEATAADGLRLAADLLERDGWCRGIYRDGMRRCVAAAIVESARTVQAALAVEAALLDHLKRNGLPSGVGIIFWNDDPQRTQDEVIAALRGAAGEG